jgi:hypothetical protein
MDNDVAEVIAAVADDECRHCLNARNDGTPAPDLCTECGRCYGSQKCQCSPVCVVRLGGAYTGSENITRITPPAVISSTPAEDAVGSDPRPVNSVVSITLTKNINPMTVNSGNVYLIDDNGAPTGPAHSSAPAVAGALITLNLAANLAFSTHYRLHVKQEVQDLWNMQLVAPYTQPTGFTTRSSDVVVPTVQSVVPANAGTTPGGNTDVIVTFSEAMNPGSIIAANLYLLDDGVPDTALITGWVMSVGNTVATGTFFAVVGHVYKLHATADCHDANGNECTVFEQAAGFTAV